MNALFFGSSARPLFGAYDPPRVRRTPTEGVVLCPPMGQEYMRAHKALRQTALQLSRAGFHVLRFDYYGTGDSGGACDEAAIAQWLDDIGTAIDEMKDTSGVSKVSLVGLRLGATLAARASAGRGDVSRLVLWDPVVDGPDYLRQLLSVAVLADGSARRLTSDPAAGQTVSVRGFPLTPPIREELATLDLASMPVRADRVLLVISREQEDYDRLARHLSAGPVPATTAMIPSTSSWERADSVAGDLAVGAMVLPQQMIQGIVEWFSEGQRP